MKQIAACLLVSCFSIFSAHSQAAADTSIKVHFGIYFKSLSMDNSTGVFDADFYWWIRFKKTNKPELDSNIVNFEYVNGINVTKDIDEKKEIINSKGDTMSYVTGRTHGQFRFHPDNKNYPMDVQQLQIIIENVTEAASACTMLPDTGTESNYASTKIQQQTEIQIPNMSISDLYYRNDSTLYNTNFGDITWPPNTYYSSLNYIVKVKRNYIGYIFKILIPLLIILLMSYLVFFIPPYNIEVVSGLSVTSLLSAIAIQIAITEPVCDYPMISNKIYYLSYFLITITMAHNIYTYNLHRNKKFKLCKRLELYGKILFPVIFVIGLIIILNPGIKSYYL